ncbi:MAG: hypothetical protein LBP58_07170, partial [Azoarcus sp.]|nr:hypothetical protein [Azoarcus sp.]
CFLSFLASEVSRPALPSRTDRQALVKSEGRRPVAIQKAVQIVSALQEIEPPHGLPRRFAPRNDGCHHPNRKRFNVAHIHHA